MNLIEVDNAAGYLRERGWIYAAEPVDVSFLSGGVSNVVLYVRRPTRPGEDFVLKQARAQLRVPQPWFCSVERIWREVGVLRLCQRLLADEGREASAAAVTTPRILAEDRENYAFTMTAAPLGHSTWKQRLLAGDLSAEIAGGCGELLGRLHAATWHDVEVASEFDDRQFFDDLRLDPYYRQVARVHSDLAAAIERLLDSVWSNRHALVHGDFSPKNLLVWDGGLMLIDFEVGHYGDPAFDLGFFLAHLVLKTLRATNSRAQHVVLVDEFWKRYVAALAARATDEERSQLERRALRNLGGCLLARVDGKSRVDYLDEALANVARPLGRRLLTGEVEAWEELLASLTGRAAD